MNLTDRTQVAHRDVAEKLLEQGLDVLLPRAQAEATLAQADAIDRLTAVLERMEFPALEIKKCLTNTGYLIRPKR